MNGDKTDHRRRMNRNRGVTERRDCRVDERDINRQMRGVREEGANDVASVEGGREALLMKSRGTNLRTPVGCQHIERRRRLSATTGATDKLIT